MPSLVRVLRATVHGALLIAVLLCARSASALSWTYLDGPYGGQPFALINDAAGNTWAGTNGAGVYYRAAGTSTWVAKPGLPTQGNYAFAIAGDGTVYVSGSGGVYSLAGNATTWTQVSGTNGLPGEAGGGLVSDAQGAVYAGMNNGNGGIHKLANGSTTWTPLGTGLPVGQQVNHLVFDAAGNLWASLYGTGVYKLAPGGNTWTQVNGGLANTNINAIIAVGNDLFAAIQFGGVVKLPNAATGGSTWVAWTGGAMSAGEGVYAFARGPNDTLYVGGYGLVFSLASGSSTWTKFASGIEAGGPTYALLYSSADSTLMLGNGSGIFTTSTNGNAWTPMNTGMTAGTTYGLVVTPGGDLYAATFGQGVQRLASGAAAWTPVDPAHMSPVSEAIAVDGNGTVYASSSNGVMKLSNGQWVAAGTSQSGFAYTLAVDGANALWAGEYASVRKLAAGGGAWSDIGAGLPQNSVYAVIPGPNGAAYAGLYNGGVFQLSANGTTWNAVNGGLPDLHVQALARDGGGTIYAGVQGGVYKLVGGAWQAVGTNVQSLGAINALVFDGNGDLYAGTDQVKVWRLPAGSNTWTQVSLGLSSRTVLAFGAGGGNLYAMTNAMSGSPSGVYRLQRLPTVVEFHNSDLDHFFITADPVEQAAVAAGMAGPGWTMTGEFFVAGGPQQVCRFYGSIVPGPNSHFYTIDPAECQQLKDIAAATPATEKRWNFESNDFASSPPVAPGQCAAGLVPVYRTYNNGFARGIDSNHRITASYAAYQAQLAAGWHDEGVVMCAPK